MSNIRFNQPSTGRSPEEEARLRRTYGQMRFSAKQQRGLPPEQEEHAGPHDRNPNHHLVTGLPAIVDGESVLAGIRASEYKTAPYSQESAGVTWRYGNNTGVTVWFTNDLNNGSLTPHVERITYGQNWGQHNDPVLDATEAAHYLEEADRLALTL